jgi:hypothetical protein
MTDKPREIWKKATPLNEAWLEYSEFSAHENFQYKRKLEALGKNPKKGKYDSQKGSVYEDYEPKDLELRWRKRLKLIAGLKNKLLDHLRYGQLTAYGFMIVPDIKTAPQEIPPGLFVRASKRADVVQWDDDIIDLGTTLFEEVRILPPAIAEASPTRSRGRPSKAADLKIAVKHALERDPGFASLTVKEARRPVTAILKNVLKIPDAQARSYSDETLRRVIKGFSAPSRKQKFQPD